MKKYEIIDLLERQVEKRKFLIEEALVTRMKYTDLCQRLDELLVDTLVDLGNTVHKVRPKVKKKPGPKKTCIKIL